MSVKELIVLPKHKFESLTNSSKDDPKEVKSVGCQTPEINSSRAEPPVKDTEDTATSSADDAESSSQEMAQRITDGIPGKLQRRPRKNRRKTIKWLPY